MLRSGDAPQPGDRVHGSANNLLRRNLTLSLLAAIVGAGIVYALNSAITRAGRLGGSLVGSQPLPDGTAVKLEQVTFGRTHKLGPPTSRWPQLPDWLSGAKSNVPTIDFGTSRDELVLWLTHRHPSAPQRTGAFQWWTDYHLLDSHGCRFDHYARELRTQGKASSSSSSISRGDRFTAPNVSDPTALSVGVMQLDSFPRREPVMTLQLFGADWGKAAQFTVPNPASSSYPEWTPLPLPQKQLDGDLSVELTRVDGIVDTWDSNRVTTRRQRVQPEFKITKAGKATNQWKSNDLRLTDATGNQASAYDCRLCVREKAWKLRTRLWRKPEADFAPEETWIVKDVPVQAAGKIRALSGAANRHSVRLELLAIAGRGSFDYKDGVPSVADTPLSSDHSANSMSVGGSSSSGPSGRHTDNHVQAGTAHVGVRVADGLPEDFRLDLLATDDRGRHIPSENSSQMDGERYLALDLPPDSRTLTLKLVVHRCRTVEFLFRPPPFRSNSRR